jgi:hypothetical protein
VTILFVITLDGLLLKKYSLVNNQLCFIEQIQLKPMNITDNQWKINKVEFISETVKKFFFFLERNFRFFLFRKKS